MLDGLFEAARLASANRLESNTTADLEQLISKLSAPVDVYSALSKSSHIKLIAEIKRRSPSRGFLADIPDPTAQGELYERHGAHAISVLTEESGFGGSLEDLEKVSAKVGIPTLRKDFISNEYQILEARAAGADFVLLILSWLKPTDYQRLLAFAHELGLGVLTETHAEPEIDVAVDSGARLVGINTRDLQTFKTDIGLFEKLANRLDASAIAVAESSVKSLEDVVRYRNAGADVALVGEALVTGDPSKLIPEFIKVS
ncbi:MAG: hypothetical protein RL418_693 [Actinomycetota bacterium]